MVLAELQGLLQDIYALEMSYDVHDFLITDERVASALDRQGRPLEEKLLICETPAEDAQVSLYLQQELLDRLMRNNPADRLNADNLRDFWTALEGISHFTYYAWNAAADKNVTLLEMELQAEVDKFIATLLLLERQGEKPPAHLHRWLFDLARFDGRLSGSELARYKDANRYAGKYCLKLAPRLMGGGADERTRHELRRFYRLSQPGKIQHIEAG